MWEGRVGWVAARGCWDILSFAADRNGIFKILGIICLEDNFLVEIHISTPTESYRILEEILGESKSLAVLDISQLFQPCGCVGCIWMIRVDVPNIASCHPSAFPFSSFYFFLAVSLSLHVPILPHHLIPINLILLLSSDLD